MFLKRLFLRLFVMPFFTPGWRWFHFARLLLLAAFVVWRCFLAIEVSSKFDEIKVSGYPTTPTELNSFYKAVPSDKNAALVMTQAFALIRQFPDKRSNDISQLEPILKSPHQVEEEALIRQYVEMNRVAMDKACEALKLPECRYPIDFSFGPNTTFPHLVPLKSLARLFIYKPQLESNEKAARELTNSIFLTLQLAHTLDNEPAVISQLVRFSIISMTWRELEWGLEHLKLNDDDLKSIGAYQSAIRLDKMRNAFAGDRAFLLPSFRLSFKEVDYLGKQQKENMTNSSLVFKCSPWTVIGITGFLERDLSYFLDCMATNISIIQLPARERLQLSNVNEELVAKGRDRYFIMSTHLLPSLSRISVKITENEVRMQLAQTAIAVERFRLAHDRLPASLSEMVPQYLESVPEDPFDGHPIRFKLLEKGYVIYSVGCDGVDDGGKGAPMRKEKQKKSSRSKAQETVDIIFKVER